MAPPSPQAPRFFVGKKLKQPASPPAPLARPRSSRAPMAWAASTTRARPSFAARACSPSIGAQRPKRSTGRMARTRMPAPAARSIASRTVRSLAFIVSGSTSQKTGRAPAAATASAAATNDSAGVTTASPAPIPSARSASSSASDPEATPTACATPERAASHRSKASTRGPRMKRASRPTSRDRRQHLARDGRLLSGEVDERYAHHHLRCRSEGSDVRTRSW